MSIKMVLEHHCFGADRLNDVQTLPGITTASLPAFYSVSVIPKKPLSHNHVLCGHRGRVLGSAVRDPCPHPLPPSPRTA